MSYTWKRRNFSLSRNQGSSQSQYKFNRNRSLPSLNATYSTYTNNGNSFRPDRIRNPNFTYIAHGYNHIPVPNSKYHFRKPEPEPSSLTQGSSQLYSEPRAATTSLPKPSQERGAIKFKSRYKICREKVIPKSERPSSVPDSFQVCSEPKSAITFKSRYKIRRERFTPKPLTRKSIHKVSRYSIVRSKPLENKTHIPTTNREVMQRCVTPYK